MAYPLSIASLHFQYKTAFDVLKAYMPDKNEDELSQMVLDFKTKKDESKPPKKATNKEATTAETPKKESKKATKKEEPTHTETPPSDAPKDESSETPKKKESKPKKPKV